jgi:AcrR family transcriptional regulator
MTVRSRPQRKARDAYHHGNLRQALIEQAVQTIRKHGVEGLTLRGAGADLRVSRTALYRHFPDKHALLAAVATEGFRSFRAALTAAWEGAGRGREGFAAMGVAYVRFAVSNPSHYRVMFGGFIDRTGPASELAVAGAEAFQVLLDAIAEQQSQGLIRAEDPLPLAQYIWATVHGIAMLVIDGRLQGEQTGEHLARLAIARIRTGIDPQARAS